MHRFIVLSEPRTGSTYLQSLLNVHFDVECRDDILCDEYGPRDDPIGDVDRQLSALRQPVVGFKTFPQHLLYHQVSLVELVRRLGVRWIIVSWRENCLEMYVSLQIALRTNVWYSAESTSTIEKVDVNGTEFTKYLSDIELRWKHVVQGWPPDIVPIFVKYEDLVADTTSEMVRILHCMSLDPTQYVFEAECRRQNPAPLSQKVSTWNQLTETERNASIDVPSIVNEAIRQQLNILETFIHLLPDREPPSPPAGWRYRVCEPYITRASKQNVLDAIDSGSVSSGGRWPEELASKLREIFDVAVAQPCCNGFAAIVLALRAARVRPGDDVILPSFTMIAVPNAVRLVGARPVPVDNAPESYNPCIREIEAAATDQTKAVIVTHTYGVPTTDMESIAGLCVRRGWSLIEDISESAGILMKTSNGSRRLLGTFGDFACASMYANKMLQGGDGGFVLAKDATHGYRLGSLVNHGFTRSYHFVHLEAAPNFKISGLAAAMATGILNSVDEIMTHRSVLARTYRRCLQQTPLKLMPMCGPEDTPWVFGVCAEDKAQRQSIRELLAKHGAETRNYFFPVHAQPAHRDQIHVASSNASFPNADYLAETGFYLPSYSALSETDIEWICSVIVSYFTKREQITECPKSADPRNSIRINDETLLLETRMLDNDGKLVDSSGGFCHHTTKAVLLRAQAERHLIMERWDRGLLLQHSMQECVAECRENGFDVGEQVLQPFIDYISSQQRHELSIEEPWTNVDLTAKDLSRCAGIPTTSPPELFRLLYWLVQKTQGVPCILELGSLFGASTAVMAVAAKQLSRNARVISVDSFEWQKWMDRFRFPVKCKPGESFLDEFQRNTSFVSDVIQVVQCNIGSHNFQADAFNEFAFDIVFIDFTRDVEELETAWMYVKPHLKDGVTVVVLNSLAISTIPFIVNHTEELMPIAKPQGTQAKVFRYVNPAEKVEEKQTPALQRRLRFLQSPDWNHHQGRAFNVTIDTLRDQIHSSEAEVDFIPAVEEFLCDFRDQILKPWVGIIHGVPEDDQFYPPDLKRLCSKRYRSAMKLCRGLFTLTSVQATYLRKHLNSDLQIPICSLRLPMLPPSTNRPSDMLRRWKENETLDLVFIGSFARDFSFFFETKVPPTVRKMLLIGDAVSQEWATKAPHDVVITARLDQEDYEEMLSCSVIMLALKYNGAANTIMLECIARNVPIAAPRIDSCIDYLGESYPLLYDQRCADMTHILTPEKVQKAIDYLSRIDKSILSIDRFCQTVQSSSVLLRLAPDSSSNAPLQHIMAKFDVTVCICSYKRTHNLQAVVDSLLEKQLFDGAVQLIVWNNNEAREKVVREICEPYLRKNSSTRHLELISSTTNHYCIIRACMLHLMRSDLLLICDDDIVPKPSFIQFFVDAHQRHKHDVLAVRGHKFLPHQLNNADPRATWTEFEHVRFVDDNQPEQLLHFLHADTCLISRDAIQDFVSIAIPDNGFVLVDDYWMSFVLSHYFNRKLRKLQCNVNEHFERTVESDEVGLALYTRPEVNDAKIRMYIHHMLNGWPTWTEQVPESTTGSDTELLADRKKEWWNGKAFIGYNVESVVTREDVADLRKLGAKVVRIGVVGCQEDQDFELSGFLDDPSMQLRELRETILLFAEFDIGVILTLHRRVVSAELWTLIATEFRHQANVVGYDLLNEPYVPSDVNCHYIDVENTPETALTEYFDAVTSYWKHIRSVDRITPIIIEPTFWARPWALPLLAGFIDKMKVNDSNIIVSVHFYEPIKLVSKRLNDGHYEFPGLIPLYDCQYSVREQWNADRIGQEIEKLRQWQMANQVKLFIGEFGIPRDTRGAAAYLRAVAAASLERNISCIVYSFRETTWDAMNYELGPRVSATILTTRLPWNENPLTKALMDISHMPAPDDRQTSE